MLITEDLNGQLFLALADISHPIEGTFYLFLIAVCFRRFYPEVWNRFLKKISANTKNSDDEDD